MAICPPGQVSEAAIINWHLSNQSCPLYIYTVLTTTEFNFSRLLLVMCDTPETLHLISKSQYDTYRDTANFHDKRNILINCVGGRYICYTNSWCIILVENVL